MQFSNVCLESWAYHLPQKRVTSSEIEARLKPLSKKLSLPSGFFEILTGIKERRVWEPHTKPSTASIFSGKAALEAKNLKATDIGCLVHVSVSRDYLEPATALAVHSGLGLDSSATCFDISNACLGFLNGIVTVSNMIELGQIKRGLVVGTEAPTPLVEALIQKLLKNDISQKEAELSFPTLTLGAGSAAMVLAHKSVSQTSHHLLGGLFQTASKFYEICQATPDTAVAITDSQITMKTQAQTLMKEAIILSKKTWPLFLNELHWQKSQVDHIFSHQVGRMPRDEMIKALDLPKDKDYPTYEFLGNMGSVSLPISFAMGVEKRHAQPNDKVVFLGFGSGINCQFLGVKW